MSDTWHNMTPANPPVDPSTLAPGSAEWIAHRDTLLLNWKNSQDVLAKAKESEMELRTAVADFVFPVASRKPGVNNYDLGNGYTLKLGHKINYSFGDESNEAIESRMDRIEAVGNVGAVLIDRLIRTKYEPSLTEYKALGDTNDEKTIKAIIDEMLVSKPGAPSLEIKEPKAKLNG